MLNAYIYPVSNRLNTGVYNPYIDNFIFYNANQFRFLNGNHPSNIGLFNILKYLHKTHVIFFNWIEKLPEFKGGYLQVAFLFMLLEYCKLRKIKIVWTVHNKIAHAKTHFETKGLIFKRMMKKSDLIITHANDGIGLIRTYSPISSRLFYFPHPVISNISSVLHVKKEIDILIWGSLVPYKGIDLFLDFLHQHRLEKRYRIKVIGKCSNEEYFRKLKSYSNEAILIENRFATNDELKLLITRSSVLLFTYASESVLSSGALAESVSYGATVIGPNKAAFKDLAEMNYIFTYSDFEEIPTLMDDIMNGRKSISQDMFHQYLENFHWSKFALKLNNELYQLAS